MVSATPTGPYIASFNVHRIITHFNQMQFEIVSHDYDIVTVYETWLDGTALYTPLFKLRGTIFFTVTVIPG